MQRKCKDVEPNKEPPAVVELPYPDRGAVIEFFKPDKDTVLPLVEGVTTVAVPTNPSTPCEVPASVTVR